MNKREGYDRVGIRELRQNLTVYLRRVVAVETLEVTDRGRPVALFTPLAERASVLQRLVAEGRVLPARNEVGRLGEPYELPLGMSVSEALQEQREES